MISQSTYGLSPPAPLQQSQGAYPRPRGGAVDALSTDPEGLSPPARGSPNRCGVGRTRAYPRPRGGAPTCLGAECRAEPRAYPRPRGGAASLRGPHRRI